MSVQFVRLACRLVRNIYRDSTDPGATYVLESGARLPQRRTLEELFAVYRGPLLLLQGMKDPLIDADARAKAIKAAYDEVGSQKGGTIPPPLYPTADRNGGGQIS